MHAQLTSWIANTGFKSCEKPTKPQDFMPSEWHKTNDTKPKRPHMTKKRLEAVANGIRMMFPNLNKKK